MHAEITLFSPSGDEARILTRGAELSSWRALGVDLLWRKDPAVWDQTAPLLFPLVGATRDSTIWIEGKAYPLGLHGLARFGQFTVTAAERDFARFTLEDDAETREQYPFAFRFEAEFRLTDGALENALIVTNIGDAPLPYACGLHPAFRWPLAGSKAQHAILFENAESDHVPRIGPGGLFSRPTRKIPLDGRLLRLAPDLFMSDALCFLNAASHGLVFDNGEGTRLRVDLEDFPHIGLWTLPPAEYLCIEPWTGHGDPEDFLGDITRKPSMRLLPPGHSARHAATFSLEKSASVA